MENSLLHIAKHNLEMCQHSNVLQLSAWNDEEYSVKMSAKDQGNLNSALLVIFHLCL